MEASINRIDRLVLDLLRDCGASMTAAEVAAEVGVSHRVAQESLDRLVDQLLASGGGFGSAYQARG